MYTQDQKELLQQAIQEITQHLDANEKLKEKNFSQEDLDVLYSLAYRLYQSGDYGQAKTVFHQLVLLEPLIQKYWLGLGVCLQLEKKYEEALKTWGMASVLDGYDPTPHFHAAECNFALGDLDQTWKTLKAAKGLLTPGHRELSAKIHQLESYLKKEAEEGA